MKSTFIYFFTSLLLVSCSDNNSIRPTCYQDENREVIQTVKNRSGIVLELEFCKYAIKPNQNLDNNVIGLLSPCNLADQFKVDSAKVIFDGLIFESFETEDICADFFEITKISTSS